MLSVQSASTLNAGTATISGMRENMSARLYRLRTSKGMSQAAVAKLIGVTRSTISQLESGLTKGPKPAHLIALAKVLDTTVDYLVHGAAGAVPAMKETVVRESEAQYLVPLSPEEVELLAYIREEGRDQQRRAQLARRAVALLRAIGTSGEDDPKRH